tara:strand:- start:1501 stop:2232 length:732 start_codon:yes stop_codon:yes gene_type:complete
MLTIEWEKTLIIFLSSVFEGAIGFDFALLAVPTLGAFIGIKKSIIYLAIPNLALMLLRSTYVGISLMSVKRYLPFIGAGSLGTILGVISFVAFPDTFIKYFVALIVLLLAIHSISKLRIHLDMRDEIFFTYFAGFFGGWFSGISYTGSALCVMFLDSLEIKKTELIKILYITTLFFSIVQVGALSGMGQFNKEIITESLIGILPAIVGFCVGRILIKFLGNKIIYGTAILIMIVSAILLVIEI